MEQGVHGAAAQQAAVWSDVQNSIGTISELVDHCMAAYGPENSEKAISITTKRRLSARALQGLKGGKELLKELASQLSQLQQASVHCERNLQYASQGHQELLSQLSSSTAELQDACGRLRALEVQRLALQEQLRTQEESLQGAVSHNTTLGATLAAKDQEVAAAAAAVAAAQAQVAELAGEAAHARAASAEAGGRVEAAAAARAAAEMALSRERAARERHEDAVARLTADNLVFLSRMKEAEAKLVACEKELAQLQQHKGPWFEEVRQEVESRVKSAMARAEELEQQLKQAIGAAGEQAAAAAVERASLESELERLQGELEAAQQRAVAAEAAEAVARDEAGSAGLLAAQQAALAAEHAAQLAVAQDSLRAMRQEVNERWAAQHASEGRAAESTAQVANLTGEVAGLQQQLADRSDDLTTQRAVNTQLMLKKEEVEWQLMAALAKLEGSGQGTGEFAPPPLCVQLMGSLHMERPPSDPSRLNQALQATIRPGAVEGGGSAAAGEGTSAPPAAAAAEDGRMQAGSKPGSASGLAAAAAAAGSVQARRSPRPAAGSDVAGWPDTAKGARGDEGGGDVHPSTGAAGGALVPGPHPSSSSSNGERGRAAAAGAGHAAAAVSPFTAAANQQHAAGGSEGSDGVRHNTSSRDTVGGSAFAVAGPEAAAAAPTSAFTAAAGGPASGASSLAAAASAGLASVQSARLSGMPDLFHLPSLSVGIASLPPDAVLHAAHSSGPFSPSSLLASTGGVMAPFSPLPRALSGGCGGSGGPFGGCGGGSGGRMTFGAVFPACATACAVTDVPLGADGSPGPWNVGSGGGSGPLGYGHWAFGSMGSDGSGSFFPKGSPTSPLRCIVEGTEMMQGPSGPTSATAAVAAALAERAGGGNNCAGGSRINARDVPSQQQQPPGHMVAPSGWGEQAAVHRAPHAEDHQRQQQQQKARAGGPLCISPPLDVHTPCVTSPGSSSCSSGGHAVHPALCPSPRGTAGLPPTPPGSVQQARGVAGDRLAGVGGVRNGASVASEGRSPQPNSMSNHNRQHSSADALLQVGPQPGQQESRGSIPIPPGRGSAGSMRANNSFSPAASPRMGILVHSGQTRSPGLKAVRFSFDSAEGAASSMVDVPLDSPAPSRPQYAASGGGGVGSAAMTLPGMAGGGGGVYGPSGTVAGGEVGGDTYLMRQRSAPAGPVRDHAAPSNGSDGGGVRAPVSAAAPKSAVPWGRGLHPILGAMSFGAHHGGGGQAQR